MPPGHRVNRQFDYQMTNEPGLRNASLACDRLSAAVVAALFVLTVIAI